MWVSTLASIGMAIGPSLVYADQFYSIVKKEDSSGFSIDVCAVLIMANITRIFFWLGDRFEVALLIQSILMIISQFALLYICLKYSPTEDDLEARAMLTQPEEQSPIKLVAHKRPLNFWQWPNYGSYLDFTAGYIVALGLIYLVLHGSTVFLSTLGLLGLGLESTLPIPQFVTNFRRKSLEGFRTTVLLGWVGGDTFKLLYFLVQNTTWQFKICAAFQLCVDLAIVGQAYVYRQK